MDWTTSDFLFAGVGLGGAALAGFVALRATQDLRARAGFAVAIFTGLALLWLNGAVGIIGSENTDANALFAIIPGLALVLALIGRLRARWMAFATLAAAAAQVALAGVLTMAGLGGDEPSSTARLWGVTTMFVALWSISAALFTISERRERA